MLQYLFLMPRKWNRSVKLRLPKRKRQGVRNFFHKIVSNAFILTVSDKDREAVLRYEVNRTKSHEILSKPVSGAYEDVLRWKIVQGYNFYNVHDQRLVKNIVQICRPKNVIKTVALPWEKEIKPTRRKVCVWYRGNKVSLIKKRLIQKGYIVDVCANNHRAYSHGMAWINNQRNVGKKMALIVQEGPPFHLHTAKHDWQYIFYKEK